MGTASAARPAGPGEGGPAGSRPERGDRRVGVVGLGYVGLPLAVAAAAAGNLVHGVDVDPEVVDAVNDGRSHVDTVSSAQVRAVGGRLRPLLERGGLVAGVDFNLAYSPERLDPGAHGHGVGDVPRVVGGLTPTCGRRAADFYRALVPEVHLTRGTGEAEAAKMLENTFRQGEHRLGQRVRAGVPPAAGGARVGVIGARCGRPRRGTGRRTAVHPAQRPVGGRSADAHAVSPTARSCRRAWARIGHGRSEAVGVGRT